ncbi:MAG: toll/interleukin-1 receptor domain-containing protein, partial [Vulcanimicrobiaceae bacterium]
MAHDVFISYSSEDVNAATAACAKLEAAGIRCWYAPRDPLPGLPYSRQLVEAIAASRVFLLIFSEHANRSNAVLSEVELAANRGLIILPYRLADVLPNEDLEYYIRKVHWLDAMTEPVEQRLDDLVTLVRKLLDTVAPRAGAPAPRPPSAVPDPGPASAAADPQ